ncbi:MAG: CCA tRNA nucleotidyltransferase [Fibrobacter sp.]|nr:CCA tRNA nucleotidyltransferase [Fibrobacter sp.]
MPHRLIQIAEAIRDAGGKCYLVGGFVRDAMLDRMSRDFDVEVYDIDQDTLLSVLKKFGRPNLVGKAFGVVHLVTHGLELDFSFPRTESKIGEGHRGFLVQTHLHLTFKEAARRRDFTVNAMGLSLPDLELSDPYDGKGDLEKKILRHVSSAFSEDSLRILRGVQFASRFGLSLAPETAELCRSLSLADLSSERIFEEFKKWLLKPGTPSLGLQAYLNMDLGCFFPEIRPLEGSFEKLGNLLDSISGELPQVADLTSQEVLAFTALLSGAKNEKEVQAFLVRITNEVHLLKRIPLLFRFIPKLLDHAEEEDFNGEFLRRASVEQNGLFLAYLYLKSTPLLSDDLRPGIAEKFKTAAEELGVFTHSPEPLLKGADLLQMGLQPGKRVGEILKAEFELQLQGEIASREAALEFGKTCMQRALFTSNGIS